MTTLKSLSQFIDLRREELEKDVLRLAEPITLAQIAELIESVPNLAKDFAHRKNYEFERGASLSLNLPYFYSATLGPRKLSLSRNNLTIKEF